MTTITREVELFGPPCNFDRRTDESSHKDTTTCELKTEQRKNMFEHQTGYRIYMKIFFISKTSSFILSSYKQDTKYTEE